MKRFVLSVLALLFCLGSVWGQDGNNLTYYLANFPQRIRLNPAYQPEYRAWVGLPVLSGVSLNYMNSSFGLNDLLQKGGKDSLYVDIDRMYKSLRKRNIISFNNENSVLTVGFRVNSWYATLDVTQKNDFVFRTNKDIFTFLKNGNAGYIGKTTDLGKLGLRASVYDEFAIGLSKQVNSRLTVGVRVKYLLGIANVHMRNSKITVHTQADGNTLELHSKQDIRLSAPVTMTENPVSQGEYIDWDNFDFDLDDFKTSMVLNTKNPGFAMDLGAEYQLNERLKLYASLTDLGFIHWGAKNYRFTQNTRFEWKGADISDIHQNIDDAFDDMIDSLKDNFRLVRGESSYTTMLHTRFYTGAEYEVSRMLSVGGLLQLSMMEKVFYPSLTASANARLLRNVSASLSYTILPGNYVNLGAGVTAKLGPFQLYVATDNLLAANYTATQSAGARFGINMLFGYRPKHRENYSRRIVAPAKISRITVQTITNENFEPDSCEIYEQAEYLVQGENIRPAYYVVLGSFEKQRKALRFKNKIKKYGMEDLQIVLNERGDYRVCTGNYDEPDDARKKVREIRRNYPSLVNPWVLKAK